MTHLTEMMLYSTNTYTWKGNTAFTSPHQLICIFSVDPDFCLQITNSCCSIYCLQDLSMIKSHFKISALTKIFGWEASLISWLSLKQHLYLGLSIVKSCQLTTCTDTGLVLVLVTCTCTWDQVLWRAAS